jgi:hypothetical protein
VSVRPETTIGELKSLFERYDLNASPVVDVRGILCGLVSRLDMARVFRPYKRRGMAGLSALWVECSDDRGETLEALHCGTSPGGTGIGGYGQPKPMCFSATLWPRRNLHGNRYGPVNTRRMFSPRAP